MPKRKFQSKKSAFTPYKRATPRKIAGRKPIANQGGGYSSASKLKLRYVTDLNLNPAIGGVAYQVYRANSLYDPDFTGVGHQPMGFDQWIALYNHYNVRKAKISVTAWASDSGINGRAIIGIRTSSGTTTHTTINSLLEDQQTIWTDLGSRYGSKSTTKISANIDIGKYLRKDYRDDSNQGSATGNPTEGVFFQVFVACLDNSLDTAEVNMVVTIDYDSLLSEPKLIAGS